MFKNLVRQNQVSKLLSEYRSQDAVLQNELQLKIMELQNQYNNEMQKLQNQYQSIQLQNLINLETELNKL